MMRMIVASLALLLAVPAFAQSADAPRSVGVGDPQRKPILDALRRPVERELRQPVKFVVEKLRVQQGWAFAQVAPRTMRGGAIDFSKTDHAQRAADGILDGDTIFALLRHQGGRWTVLALETGPTDVPWLGWDEEFGAPTTLLRAD